MEACTEEIKIDTLLHHWISILAVGQTKHITGSSTSTIEILEDGTI